MLFGSFPWFNLSSIPFSRTSSEEPVERTGGKLFDGTGMCLRYRCGKLPMTAVQAKDRAVTIHDRNATCPVGKEHSKPLLLLER